MVLLGCGLSCLHLPQPAVAADDLLLLLMSLLCLLLLLLLSLLCLPPLLLCRLPGFRLVLRGSRCWRWQRRRCTAG